MMINFANELSAETTLNQQTIKNFKVVKIF